MFRFAEDIGLVTDCTLLAQEKRNSIQNLRS